MPRAPFSCGLVLALLAAPALAQREPSCFTPDAVEQRPGNPEAWLLKARPAEVKRLLEKRAGSKDWRGDQLYVPCGAPGTSAATLAASVEGGLDEEEAARRKQVFSNLAKRSGHSEKEADALAKKYAQRVDGAFFRRVRDDDGELAPEDELILRRHRRQLAADERGDPGIEQTRSKQSELRALGAKLEAAQQRGDTAEVMRLAARVQKLSAPAVEAAKRATNPADQQAWDVAERALPELAKAAYPTRVTVDGMCGRCVLPPSGALDEK